MVCCGACGSDEIEHDTSEGLTICAACGLVLDDLALTTIGSGYGDESPGTTFVRADADGARANGSGVSSDYHVKRKRHLRCLCARACDHLNVPAHTSAFAEALIERALDDEGTSSRVRLSKMPGDHLVGAAVYLAARADRSALSVLSVANALPLPPTVLGRAVRRFSSVIPVQLPGIDSRTLMGQCVEQVATYVCGVRDRKGRVRDADVLVGANTMESASSTGRGHAQWSRVQHTAHQLFDIFHPAAACAPRTSCAVCVYAAAAAHGWSKHVSASHVQRALRVGGKSFFSALSALKKVLWTDVVLMPWSEGVTEGNLLSHILPVLRFRMVFQRLPQSAWAPDGGCTTTTDGVADASARDTTEWGVCNKERRTGGGQLELARGAAHPEISHKGGVGRAGTAGDGETRGEAVGIEETEGQGGSVERKRRRLLAQVGLKVN